MYTVVIIETCMFQSASQFK